MAFLLPGCQVSYPGFAERSRQDCERGDREACQMLSALDPSASRRTMPGRTQVQKDVQAILQGIEKARASQTFGTREETPSAPPETKAPPAPTGGDASSPAAPNEP